MFSGIAHCQEGGGFVWKLEQTGAPKAEVYIFIYKQLQAAFLKAYATAKWRWLLSSAVSFLYLVGIQTIQFLFDKL